LENLPNNLPIQLTSFVGREKELADVRRLLQNTHLLTLIGPGGTGKTRLSIQAASEVLDQYPDGAWFVELAPILDPQLVPRMTAIAIGLRDEPQRPVIDMLCDYLHEKKILLVLDNCEHLVDACARMADQILRTAPDTRLLASSREGLGIAGEVTYRVPSLELPDIQHLPPLESLSQYEAVKLFIDRATSAVPTFLVTNKNAPALAQVCHHLDGIPLAIELAAAKIRVLSVEQIAQRLDDRFRLLTGGSRTVLERHQTLRATIDWSYNILSKAEQVLFQRLSVFVGGWTLEAAESICGAESASSIVKSDDVLNLLEQLIHKSLVIKEEAEHESRYHMLETIRQYAREKLLEAEGIEAIRDKHLAYFVKLVEQAEPELYRSDQVFWLNKLDDELDNFRGALEWALAKDVESGLRIAAIPWRFWQRRDYLQEMRSRLGQLLDRYPTPDSLRAQALAIRSHYVFLGGNITEARAVAEQGLQLARSLSDRQNEALCLLFLGKIIAAPGAHQEGISLFEQSLAIYRVLGDKIGQATATISLATHHNDPEHSQSLFLESLRLHRDLGNLYDIAFCLTQLARRMILAGDLSSPSAWLEEAKILFRELGAKVDEGNVINYFGILAYWQGNYQQALTYFEQAIDLFETADNPYWPTWPSVSMAYVFLREGDRLQASTIFKNCLEQFQKDENVIGMVYTIEGFASLCMTQERLKHATRLFAWADAMREKLGDDRQPVEQNSVDYDLAIIRSRLDKAEFARFSEEGRALTIEQATALALKSVDQITEIKLDAKIPIPATLPSQREVEKQKYGGLTSREREVAAQIAQGKSNQAIAAELFVSLKTVEANVTRILSKLGFTSRAQIAGWAVAKGLAEAPRDLNTLGREA
jgi:predicted ATPase/DNA-binding CsgD family transcriptional regulator